MSYVAQRPEPEPYHGGLAYWPAWTAWRLRCGSWVAACGDDDRAECIRLFRSYYGPSQPLVVLPRGERPSDDDDGQQADDGKGPMTAVIDVSA